MTDVNPRLRTRLDVISTIALVTASAVMIWAVLLKPTPPPPPPPPPQPSRDVPIPSEPVSLEGAMLRGNQAAKVALMEFSEFQCPFCAKFTADTLPELVRDYVDTGVVRWAFRHLPLVGLHPYARGAAEIAACADLAGHFWSVHDAFFKMPRITSADEFRRRAEAEGVGGAELEACLKRGQGGQLVERDLQLAKSLQVHTTPAFLVGRLVDGRLDVTQTITGARPVADFRLAIEKALGASVSGGY